jgi:modification methylase
VSKKLGRNFIGVERDKNYIKIAQKRIDAVKIADKASLAVEKPKPARIPFGSLLESGLLKPGQILYYAKDRTPARILANGHLKCGELIGSIHAVAKELSNGAPANGWDSWLYKENGRLKVIDELRERIRKLTENEHPLT